MEIRLRQGLHKIGERLSLVKPPPTITGEVLTDSEVEMLNWEAAALGPGLLREDRYAAVLARRDDPAKKVFASFYINPSRIALDIPLRDPSPEAVLRQQAYETTFFGEVDPAPFQAFATEDIQTGHLMAFLNRTAAGTPPEGVSTWFNATFGVKLGDHSGDYFISSHGGEGPYGYQHNSTIETTSKPRNTGRFGVELVRDFAHGAQNAFRHLSIEPLPMESYLQAVQSTLKFLPRDWKQLN